MALFNFLNPETIKAERYHQKIEKMHEKLHRPALINRKEFFLTTRLDISQFKSHNLHIS